jgi:predicted transcriptional regulator
MFYILFKDQWTEHQFLYLTPQAQKARLEPTMPGRSVEQQKKFLNKRSAMINENEPVTLYHIMSKELIAVDCHENLKSCHQRMEQDQIHHLLITKNKKFLGLLSARDLLQYKHVNNASIAAVETILNTVVVGAHESTPLGQAALVLKHEKISSMIVLDDDKEIIGIVTVNDFLEKIAEIMP